MKMQMFKLYLALEHNYLDGAASQPTLQNIRSALFIQDLLS
jgi:hypothetical protein